jgi:hypothetical protein
MTPSVILLVTWFIQGQPPSSYQTQFTSTQACEVARNSLAQQADQLKRQVISEAISRGRQLGIPDYLSAAGAKPPQVTAVCVNQ